MATKKQKHILVAPLDWGLGHTTRCVPLIRHIQSLGHIPLFAGNAAQCSFIEETFGSIEIIHLEGYNISYSQWNKFGQAGLFLQLPSIHKTIHREHDWLKKLTAQRQIDGIISDNRYGLFHQSIPSVILTHQLQIQTGFGNFANRAIQKVHYQYLNKFNETWVVDASGTPNLAGNLSHTSVLPHNTKYVGLLSRFEASTNTTQIKNEAPLLMLLSGPEPQRTAIAQLLWQQALTYNDNIIFIEGSLEAITPTTIPAHIKYHKRLAGTGLEQLIKDASLIICRSGYSALMDLITLRKKAILIPTPGQTEQQYLAKHLCEQGIFYSTQQNGFNLQNALNAAQQFSHNKSELQDSFHEYKKVLEDWSVLLDN